ncbi:cytochrome P450 [Xylaria cf. heliscus]|nr:cytochrome P450 [Xylaria cf. heliscus]
MGSWFAEYSQSSVLFVVVLVILLPTANYAIISIRSQLRSRSRKDGRRPPDIPYWIPFFGHILSVARNQSAFLRSITDRYGVGIPLAVKIGPLTLYLLSTPEAFMGLTKTSEHLTPKPAIALAMHNIFGTHKAAGRVYTNDDSGIGPKPLPGSTVSHKNRIWFHQSSAARKYLSGTSLKTITERFMGYLVSEIASNKTTASSDNDWVELPDLYDFWKNIVFVAALNALYGPLLLKLNPDFVQEFWDYNAAIPTLMMGFPRWLTPKAYEARDKVLTGIKKWHRHALERSDVTNTEAEWDDSWGSAYLKVRYNFRSPVDHMDADAHAADDLALLVAANANAVMCSAWFILETLREPTLIPKLLAEVDRARKPGSTNSLDINVLCSQPLLQSIYAETLRLRIGLMINRTSQHREVRIGPWKFPPNRPIAISSMVVATNPQIWGDRNGEKPLDKFWAERFVLYPDDEQSGPWSLDRRDNLGVDQKPKQDTPIFTMDGMSDGWIPYGAGEFMCPGRHFAKQEMIGSFAVFLDNYDVEILLPDGWVPEPDMKYFGTGALPPKKAVPFRIRRRVKP